MNQKTSSAGVHERGRGQKTPLYTRLYFQVLLAIAIGVTLGVFHPELAQKMQPLGNGFIKLVKMMIGPIIFTTSVVGIAKMGDMKEVGRVGIKALIYFELVSTLALLLGVVMVQILQPGQGLNLNLSSLDSTEIMALQSKGGAFMKGDVTTILMGLIPESIIKAFAEDNILQILLFSILFGVALSNFGNKGRALIRILDQVSHTLFGVVNIIMKLAPVGAFGAMAFTVGKYGFESLINLGSFLVSVYLACALFVVIVLGGICKYLNISLWKFLKYIKEEIFIVLATSSSESALPRMMVKMENLGCAKPVVGLVIPTGYSFNLDGTSIYLGMAAIFLAQATNVHLSLGDQLSLLMLLFLTSKGAAAVTGGGFIVLISTLISLDLIPIASASILLGIDRFMSEARAITNLIGNGIATVVISKWENAFNAEQAAEMLGEKTPQIADNPEVVADQYMKDYWF